MAEVVEDVELAPEAPGKGSKIKPLVFLLAGVVLAVGGTLGALYFMGILPPRAEVAVEDGAAEPAAEPEPAGPAVYVSLEPQFTVNFREGGGPRYLQVGLQAVTRDPDVEKQIKLHMPVIRNDLMMLFAAQSPATLGDRAGKEALRAEVVKAIQAILERETGDPGIESVYFTSFVMQ